MKSEAGEATSGEKAVAAIRSFRELHVYQPARAAAKRVFQISRSLPSEEKYSLTSQRCRASRSVGANVAESWRKRRYAASFVSKLSDANAEAAEVRAWLDAALDCRYIDQATFKDLDACYNRIGAQLRLMMDRPEKWCTRQGERG